MELRSLITHKCKISLEVVDKGPYLHNRFSTILNNSITLVLIMDLICSIYQEHPLSYRQIVGVTEMMPKVLPSLSLSILKKIMPIKKFRKLSI